MPRGDKSSYTDKQKRQAEHIEEGYEDRGVPEKEAEKRAWATVNKVHGGGKQSGSASAKKAAQTRKRHATGRSTLTAARKSAAKKSTARKTAPKKATTRKTSR